MGDCDMCDCCRDDDYDDDYSLDLEVMLPRGNLVVVTDGPRWWRLTPEEAVALAGQLLEAALKIK